MTDVNDTIVAQATPPGRGGVGILRISGPSVSTIATSVLGRLPKPRVAEYLAFRDFYQQPIDLGLALYFPAPNSFTGEDVLELHGHGGPIVLDLLLKRILELGARAAEPGEFTKRAFLNDKIDLSQAEAVADLINAQSTDAAKSAIRSLSGEFSTFVNRLVENVIQLRMFIESAIDFPEEEIDFLSDESIATRLRSLLKELTDAVDSARQGSLLNEGVRVLILGKPNAGKSSLLNVLAGEDVAIVTDIAGTTRDMLRENIQIDGIPLQIIDTAGLREDADIVEREGIRRALEAAKSADHIVYVVDDVNGISDSDRALWRQFSSAPLTIVLNKIDVSGRASGKTSDNDRSVVSVSTRTKAGIPELKQHLKTELGYRQTGEGVFLARRRHLEALKQAQSALQKALDIFYAERAGEFIAEELRHAQHALNEITGEFDNEALLGRIFSSFCIGK